MGSSLELSLSLKPSHCGPKTIANLLKDVSKIGNLSDRLTVLNDYLQKHQAELYRIQAFKQQLPQCILLLKDAVERLKEEVMKIKRSIRFGASEPLMEFSSTERTYKNTRRDTFDKYCREEKNDFMSSSSQIYELNHGDKKQKPTLDSCPFQLSSTTPELAVLKCPGQELAKGLGYDRLNQSVNDQPLQSKPMMTNPAGGKQYRRSWTSELHARFVEALAYLGGPEVATPKQIRDVMKVEGLTNDQVKSHLQKYRLHIRRAQAANVILLECVEKLQEPWTSEFYYIGMQPIPRDPVQKY